MSQKLAGKVVIITGTGGSIGREAALLFAREGALVVGPGSASRTRSRPSMRSGPRAARWSRCSPAT